VDPETKVNLVNVEKWTEKKDLYELTHRQILNKDLQNSLRKHKFDFKLIDKLYSNGPGQSNGNIKTDGAVTDEDQIRIRPEEKKKVREVILKFCK